MLEPPESWAGLPFFDQDWPKLREKLAAADSDWQPKDPFLALRLTPRDQVRVVILGQDPYPTKGRATGLAFSFPPRQPPKHSLANILAELANDTGQCKEGGDLSGWASQGVLLLNTTLTVPVGKIHGHKKLGWNPLVRQVLAATAKDGQRAFVLWGRQAQKICKGLPRENHLFLCTPHPSPNSAKKGFFGSKPFSTVNKWLESRKVAPVNWSS